MTGPRACGSLFGEVEARDPALDRNGDGKLDRLVEHDPIAVEQTFGGRFSVRQLGDGRAQFVRRALEDGGEGIGDRGRAETTRTVPCTRAAPIWVTAIWAWMSPRDQRRLAAVGEDDALDIGLRDAAVHDLDRRQQQALLKHLGGVGGGRAGDGAAHVRLVRYRARERDDSPAAKTGATNAMSETWGRPPS